MKAIVKMLKEYIANSLARMEPLHIFALNGILKWKLVSREAEGHNEKWGKEREIVLFPWLAWWGQEKGAHQPPKSLSKKRHPQYRLLQFCSFLCLKYTLKASSDNYKKYMGARYSPKIYLHCLAYPLKSPSCWFSK